MLKHDIIFKSGGKNIPDGLYTPANPHPKLSQVQNTFTGGTMSQITTTEPTTLYRVYGGDANKIGSYWSATPQNGGLQSQMDLALNPSWGNTADNIITIEVPAGSTIYIGTAGPQSIGGGTGILPGGGSQVFIDFDAYPKSTINSWIVE